MLKQPLVAGLLLILVVGAVIFGIVKLGASGNTGRASAAKTTKGPEQDDPLAILRDTLRKERNFGGCKAVTAQANVILSHDTERRFPPLSPANREMLKRDLQLSEAELDEVTRDEFSPLDAYYLDECVLFYDGIRSLKLDIKDESEAGQLQRARLGLAWALREVWRHEQSNRPAPPDHVLRRGSGNDSERAGVALATLQILGLDGCVVTQSSEGAAGPPWAVGARIGKNIYLWDLRGGVPISGSNDSPVATLAQVREHPDIVKSIAGASGDPKAFVAASRVALAPPLSALAPRMRFLQTVLGAEPTIRLAVDLADLRKRFEELKETVAFWNPRSESASPVRSLAYFVPPAEGGLDRASSQVALQQFHADLIPMTHFPPQIREGALPGEPGRRLRDRFGMGFVGLAMDPRRPRDQVLRGHFDEATRALIETQTNIGRSQERIALAQNLDQDARQWAEEMTAAYAAMIAANKAGGPDSVAAAQARANVEALNQKAQPMVLVVERAAAEPMEAQTTFLLALCKHEQAERLSRQGQTPEEVREAWKNAEVWWRKYDSRFGSLPWIPAGQVAHARALRAAAARQAGSSGAQGQPN
jgi:hypothetical protein